MELFHAGAYAKVFPRVLRGLFGPVPVAAIRPFDPVCNFSVIIPTFHESKNIFERHLGQGSDKRQDYYDQYYA
ncbi:MAG: hypothetical protein ABII06_01945 [Pseudomonadota bacterium]